MWQVWSSYCERDAVVRTAEVYLFALWQIYLAQIGYGWNRNPLATVTFQQLKV